MFKRLSTALSRISAGQYLLIVVFAQVALSYLNLLYCTLRYEFGFGYVSCLAGADDRLADLIKMTFSYRPFLSKIGMATFQSWPDVFKDYFVNPIYGGKEALAAGQCVTHLHVPPLMTLQFLACASLINRTQSIYLAIAVFYALYLATVQYALRVGIPPAKRTARGSLAAWFFALLSYPALIVFSRGNIQGGITALFIIAFLLSVFLRDRVELAALLSLAIAVNLRPNAIIFALAIPLVLGLEKSLKPVMYFLAFASGIFALSYFAANRLYPDYTLRTFLRGVAVYKKLYVFGPLGDGGNSSLWALLKNYGTISASLHNRVALVIAIYAVFTAALFWGARHLSHWTTVVPLILMTLYARFVTVTGNRQYLSAAFFVFSFVLAEAVWWEFWQCSRRTLVAPFVLTAFYCLLSPVFADYHLLVFLAPILIVYFTFQEWPGNFRAMAAITLASVLILSPKNYVIIAGLSLQTLLNPLILYFATLYVVRVARDAPLSRAAESPVESAAKLERMSPGF